MFGMPLVFLPCRGALLSIPNQVREWREAVQNVEEDSKVMNAVMKGAKHHVPNGVTFDEECPLVLEQAKKISRDDILNVSSDYGTVSTETSTTEEESLEAFVVTTEPVPPVDPSIVDVAGRRDRQIHVLSTIGVLILSYIMAVGVPGVGVVWSIAGSSMAIIIGFIIPASCYLKIRSKKSVNPRSIGAFLLLIFSIITSIVCTLRTVRNL